MENDETKLELEIAELRQKLKWEPLKSLLTLFGVIIAASGFLVERYITQINLSYDIDQRAHIARVERMTEISKHASLLCQQTFNVIRDKQRVQVFGAAMTRTLVENIQEIAKQGDNEKQQLINAIISELRKLEAHFANQSNELDYWTTAINLEGRWQFGANSPTPDFSLHFPSNLSAEWKEIAKEGQSILTTNFSLLGDTVFPQGFIARCNEFIASLEQTISDQDKAFCIRHSVHNEQC